MKKRLLTLGVLAAIVAMNASAEQINENEALAIAQQLGKRSVTTRAKSQSNETLKLAHTATDNGQKLYYAFNRGTSDGYVIVAADDKVQPIIGYADSGNFDYNNMPDNMRWWLSECQRQIAYAIENDIEATTAHSKAPQRDRIDPLMKTKWNQDGPYNNLCPKNKKGTNTSATGCVATAVAQIMKHHEWPKEATINGVNYTYNWGKMLPKYNDETETKEEKNAVAELMYSFGKSVNMQYDEQSGAQSYDVVESLFETFGYDGGMMFLKRDNYSYAEWFDLIYTELKENRPVYYSGYTNDYGGHAFVCDGYDGNGMFHINWGWGGMSDGYFSLITLNPDAIGIGGYEGGFSFDQDIITGIQKAKDGSESRVKTNVVCTNGFFTTEKEITRGNTSFTFKSRNISRKYYGGTFTDWGLFVNFSAKPVTITLGVKITKVGEPDSYTYAESSEKPFLAEMYSYRQSFNVLSSKMPEADGEYEITPAVKTESGDWADIASPLNQQRMVKLTISNGGKQLKVTNEGKIVPDVEVSFNSCSMLYPNKKFEVVANISLGNEDFDLHEPVQLCIINKETDKIVFGSELSYLTVESNENVSVPFIGSLDNVSQGEYFLALCTEDGQFLGNRKEVTVNEPLPNAPSLKLTKSIWFDDNNNVPLDDLRLHVKLKNATKNSYYAGEVYAYVFSAKTYQAVAPMSTKVVFAPSDEILEFDLTGTLPEGTPGEKYIVQLYYFDDKQNKDVPFSNFGQITFTLGGVSAVETVAESSEVLNVQIYDIFGNLVQEGVEASTDNLPAGIYIVRTQSANGYDIKKIVK